MVSLSTLVLAAPESVEEVLRSGTWATVRYARKNNTEVYLIPPR